MRVVSVRLKSIVSISDKALKIEDFNGNIDIIPKSQFFGQDYEVLKSNAYWISEWILEQKKITYSNKKIGYEKNGKINPYIHIEKHIPSKVTKKIKHDESLVR